MGNNVYVTFIQPTATMDTSPTLVTDPCYGSCLTFVTDSSPHRSCTNYRLMKYVSTPVLRYGTSQPLAQQRLNGSLHGWIYTSLYAYELMDFAWVKHIARERGGHLPYPWKIRLLTEATRQVCNWRPTNQTVLKNFLWCPYPAPLISRDTNQADGSLLNHHSTNGSIVTSMTFLSNQLITQRIEERHEKENGKPISSCRSSTEPLTTLLPTIRYAQSHRYHAAATEHGAEGFLTHSFMRSDIPKGLKEWKKETNETRLVYPS